MAEPVSAQLIERLLYQSEGTALDFKNEQYPFDESSSAEKAKLVKDLLSFVNAFREGDAYILIGVAEVEGGQAEVVGVDTHLKDADLQTLLKGKFNHDLIFEYHKVEIEGKSVGVLRIPKQERPITLKKDFGVVGENGETQRPVLKADVIYFHVGSSNGIATLHDAYRMGVTDTQRSLPKAEADFGFGDPLTKQIIGVTKNTPHMLTKYEKTVIPDMVSRSTDVHGYFTASVVGMQRGQRNFWRQAALYVTHKKSFAPLWFSVTNHGGTMLKDVTAEISCATHDQIMLMAEAAFPNAPDKMTDFPEIRSVSLDRMIGTRRSVDLAKRPDKQVITINFGKVQTGKSEASIEPIFFCPSRQLDTSTLDVLLTADEFQKSQHFTLTITPTVNVQEFKEWKPLKEFIEKHYDDQW